MKRTMVAISLSCLLGTAVGSALASEDSEPSVYTIRKGPGIPRLVVRGDGCLQAEDSLRLRLVDWDPSNDKVVYRCIRP